MPFDYSAIDTTAEVIALTAANLAATVAGDLADLDTNFSGDWTTILTNMDPVENASFIPAVLEEIFGYAKKSEAESQGDLILLVEAGNRPVVPAAPGAPGGDDATTVQALYI